MEETRIKENSRFSETNQRKANGIEKGEEFAQITLKSLFDSIYSFLTRTGSQPYLAEEHLKRALVNVNSEKELQRWEDVRVVKCVHKVRPLTN